MMVSTQRRELDQSIEVQQAVLRLVLHHHYGVPLLCAISECHVSRNGNRLNRMPQDRALRLREKVYRLSQAMSEYTLALRTLDISIDDEFNLG